MNDNEIINNFKILVYDFRGNCGVKTYEVLKATFDLINRQKAEIEKLNIELKAMRGSANFYKAEVERLEKHT